MLNVLDVSMTQLVSQQTMNYFSSPLTLTISKLDADQYIAEDIDGVTESLFGSGNLNFLVMQSSQTNKAMSAVEPFPLRSESFSSDGGWASAFQLNNINSDSSSDFSNHALPSQTGLAEVPSGVSSASFYLSEMGSKVAAPSSIPLVSGAGFSGVGLPLVSSGNGLNGVSANGMPGSDGLNGVPGESGLPGMPGGNGTNGDSGSDGVPGMNEGGGGTTIINVEASPGDTIINLGDINIGDVIVNLGDINLGDIIVDIGDILNIDLCDITNIITNVVIEVVNIVTDVTTIITDITTNTTHILTDITNNVTHIVTDAMNVVDTLIGDGLTIDLDALLGVASDLDLSLISAGTVFNLLDQVVDFRPVTDLLEPRLDLDGLILTDIHSVLSLLHDGGHGHASGDMDLGIGLNALLGEFSLVNGITDIVFNPIEDILGDIDLLADIGLRLFDANEVDNSAGDTDIALDLGLGLMDGPLLGGRIDIPIDSVEKILGDIDLDIGAATNFLGDTAQNIVDDFAGGSGEDTLLSGIGDTLSDIAGDLLPGIGGSGGHDDVAADIDLGLLNYELANLDVSEALDFAEPLVGDIDLSSRTGLNLFGDNETSNKVGDTDIDLDLDIDVLGIDIVEVDFVDVPLDAVESLLGDIDINLNMAIDLLNADCDDKGVSDLLHNNGGGGDLLAWTNSILPDLDSFLGHGSDYEIGGILPAPVGDITEGLGGLLGGDLPGGLFGGGLFG